MSLFRNRSSCHSNKRLTALIVLVSVLFVGEVNTAQLAQEDPLVLGIFPRRNASITIELFRPIANELSELLGREVRVVTSSDFPSFWRDVAEQKYDIVHYNQYHYVKSHKEFGYEVIGRNVELDRETISTAFIVRKDSGINSLADLKGKRIIFGGGKKAMMSYVVPQLMLSRAGLSPNDYETAIARNPPNAVISVYMRQADASTVGDVVFKMKNVTDIVNPSEMKIIARSDAMILHPWAVKASLDPQLKQQISSVITSLHKVERIAKKLEKAQINAILPVTDNEYDPHREVIKAVYGEDYYQ